MKGSFRKRGCKCPGKKCNCGATWSFRIDIGIDSQTGKRKQKEANGFRTRGDAEAAAAKLYTELMQGTYVAEKDVLFKDFATEWLKLYGATGKVKESSVRIRKMRLQNLLKYFSHFKIKDISKKMYQDMLFDLMNKEYAHETLVSIHSTGRMLFKKAMELEIIKANPTQYAVVPSVQKTLEEIEKAQELPKYLEKEQLSAFLNVARKKGRDYALFITLAYTGIRIGELCVLKWKDVDFEERKISINRTLYNEKNNTTEFKLQTPKTKKSKREIEVDDAVFAELEKHRAAQDLIKSHKDTYYDKDFVFVRASKNLGYPESPNNIIKRMRYLLSLANLNVKLTPHSLRHTHTSLLAEAGVGLESIMDRLGHKDDAVTRYIYLHVTKTMKKEASHKFSELMRNL
ncbi:MAG: Integrase [Bacilli bacterium]|nr:Integrase [Bacilli bacterium]